MRTLDLNLRNMWGLASELPQRIGVAPTEVVFSETTFPVWGILGNTGLKNSPFASCAGPLKIVGSVTVTGLVDAIGRR